MTDATVKPTPVVLDFDPMSAPVADALQRILRDTDYRFRQTGENTYLVYRPITCVFAGQDLRGALQELSDMVEVLIIPCAGVTGTVYAEIREQPLEKALEMMLAGTPYVLKKTPEYYLVTERAPLMADTIFDPLITETRSILLNSITLERAKRLLPADHAVFVTAGLADPNHQGHVLTVTAPASLADRIAAELQKMDTHPRHVLLDVRVATMRHPDLLDLGIEWGTEPLVTNGPSDKEGIRVGYVRDRASTDSLLAGLNRLTENRRAELVAAPQLVAQDGQPSQVPPMGGEVHSYWIGESRTEQQTRRIELQRVDEGSPFSITPHVGDHNDITLEISAAISDSRPNSQRGGPPIVVRRALKNTTTVKDGGTVVWAGRAKSGSEAKRAPGLDKLPLIGPLFRNNDKDKTPREVVIFVTARLADLLPTDSLPASQPAATTIRIPPLPAREEQGKREPRSLATTTTGNLIEILTNLSQRTGAKITIDATVKPTPVALDFDPIDMPVAKALQRILQGTDYRFRIVGDNAYLVYRPITCLYAGRDLREALQDLSVAAEVPIIPDPNVTGQVWADIREQPVEKALEILLAGTGYVVKRTPDYYLVTDRNVRWPGLSEVSVTRVVPLSYVTPERVKRLISPAFAPYMIVDPADPRDPYNRGSIVTITAPASLADRIVADVRRFDARPRLALLDMRVVVMKHSDLLDLGIEWAAPVESGDPSPDSASVHNAKTAADTMNEIRIGCLSGRAATARIYEALHRLREERRASIPWSPQYLVQDGRLSHFNLFSDEWFIDDGWSEAERQAARAEVQRIAPEAVLSLTPRIPEGNEITLEMSLELSENIPKDEESSPPTVIRRIAKNAIRLSDGSTLVWAGLAKSGSKPQRASGPDELPLIGPLFRNDGKDKAPRQVVVFVTAHLISETYDSRAASGVR